MPYGSETLEVSLSAVPNVRKTIAVDPFLHRSLISTVDYYGRIFQYTHQDLNSWIANNPDKIYHSYEDIPRNRLTIRHGKKSINLDVMTDFDHSGSLNKHGHMVFKRLFLYEPCVTFIMSRAKKWFLSKPEIKAIDTLHEIIGEQEFRRYLKYGFITVTGSSGKSYQIRNEGHTMVRLNGKVVEEICFYLKDVPPTDQVIAKRHILLTDETAFRSMGNIYKKAA